VLNEAGQVIRHVYFPHQAVISLVNMMENGSIVEAWRPSVSLPISCPRTESSDAKSRHRLSTCLTRAEQQSQEFARAVVKAEANDAGPLRRDISEPNASGLSQSAATRGAYTGVQNPTETAAKNEVRFGVQLGTPERR
jgi:hypothetical protein